MRRLIVAAMACQLVALPSFAAAPRRVLLTVDGLNLPAGQTIRAFHIQTWGVEFLAVCRLPPSWRLSSEKFEDPEGRLDGKADTHGAALKSLSNTYLLDVYDYQPRPRGNANGDYHPASFAGWVDVGQVEPFDGGIRRKRTLKSDQFRMRDAQGCPAPPAPQP